MSKKIILIDGNSIMNRAFYGIPLTLTSAKGLHTNAIFGFLNIMFRFIDEAEATHMIVAFDLKAPTFRHEMYTEYKANRTGMPDELREQMPVLKDVLRSMNIVIVEKEGYEADDILGTIGREAEEGGFEVSIVSGDRDLLQLATEKTLIRIPKTKMTGTEVEDYYEKDVAEKMGVTPLEFIQVKGLMGDTSDNIPGLAGVGPKTATKIIQQFKTIENAYEHIDEVKPNKAREALREHYDIAILSRELATIKTDCPLDYQIDETSIGNMYNENSFQFFKELGFKKYLNRFEKNGTEHEKEKQLLPAFQRVNDLAVADEIVHRVMVQKEPVGLQMVFDKEIWGLSITAGAQEVYYIVREALISEEYLADVCAKLIHRAGMTAVMDLKAHLPWAYLPWAHLPWAHDDKACSTKTGLVFDVGVAAYLMNPLKDSYAYHEIAGEYLDMLMPSSKELMDKKSFEQMALFEDEDKLLQCGCYQSYTAWRDYPLLLEKLKETDMLELYQTVEMPLIYVLHDMETRGIQVEQGVLEEFSHKLGERIVTLEKEIYLLAEETFNINSPKQLGEILFDKLKLPFAKKTKTGYSTAADLLDKLAPDYPIVKQVLEYRQYAKLKSTYADGLIPYIQSDGRIHGRFNQTITATGRISSTEPNLQNIPIKLPLGREIRKAFVPAEGCVFIDGDYSQIELRVLAHISEDDILIKAYKENQDIHSITASQVFHTPFEEVTDLQRRNAKAVNFGIVYGISNFGLSEDLHITRKEADDYIQQYFMTYPKIKAFLDHMVDIAKKDGYVSTMYKRRRPIPEIHSSNYNQRSFGERVAMNSPIQGAAADIIKMAMIRVNNVLADNQMKSRLILQVHDELLVEAVEREVSQVKEILRQEMEQVVQLRVPLSVDLHVGDNWYEAK